jgi:hypothetical protein
VSSTALIAGYLSSWHCAYWVRTRGEMDVPLDNLGRRVRAFVQYGGLAVWQLCMPLSHWASAAAFLVSLHFACWPNLAYRVVAGLRAIHVFPAPTAAYARALRAYWGSPEESDLAQSVGRPDRNGA